MTSSNTRPSADINEIRELVAQVLEIPVTDVTDHAHLADVLNVDSLAQMEIAARLEKRYRIDVPESDIASLTTSAMIREFVNRKLSEGPADPAADTAGGTTP